MKLRHGDDLLAEKVQQATNICQRTRGLMFRDSWDAETSLWIHRCNSIHTAFVRFPIDVVFVDKNLQVKKVILGIKPWRLIPPVFSASSVFEFVSCDENKLLVSQLKPGDQLHVGD